MASALYLCGMTDEEEIDKRVMAALLNVGMDKYAKRTPDTLSGGQQQRVAIARALITKPAIVLADEPTGNLDSKTKEELHNLFFRLRDKYGQTIVIVTHDPDLAKMCDRSLYMVDGLFAE